MSECTTVKKNIGLDRCNKILQLPRGILEAPPGFKFTPEDYASSSALKAAIEDLIYAPIGSRGYLWPFATDFENASEAPVYQETPLSDMKVRNGKYRFRYYFSIGMCNHKAAFTHNSQGGQSAFYIYDVEEGLYGRIDEETGDLYPFKAALSNLENLRISDGSVSTASPLYIVLSNSNDLNLHGGRIDGSVLETIQPLTDVEVTVVGSPSATEIVVDVKTVCDGTPVNGLVIADFVKTGTGTMSGVTEVNGRYTIAGTSLASGTIDIDPPGTLSIDGFESIGPATVTIS